MQIYFRKMTPDDASEVEIVEKACFSIPWSRESFWQEASNDKAFYLVAVDKAEAKEKIVGYAGMWVLFGEAQITNVAIMPKYQGKGISRLMMNEMIDLAKKHLATAMTLEVRPSNYKAINLYTSLGFKSVGRRPNYYEDGEDADIMWITDLSKTK